MESPPSRKSELPKMNARKVTALKYDWRFTRQKQSDALEIGCDDSGWETVRVPHDWAIAGPFDKEHDISRKVRPGQADIAEGVTTSTGRTGGLPHIGEGWYRKTITIPESSRGLRFRLECDGIMSHSCVYVNGLKAGSWPYGYSSFAFDVTDLVKPGEQNVIAVHVNNPGNSSRWYPGAGIYRHVRLVELNPIHIDHWGVAITTPEVTESQGILNVKTTIANASSSVPPSVTIRTTVLCPEGTPCCSEESQKDISDSSTFEQSLAVTKPQRWSIETPMQYTVRSEVVVEGEVVDTVDTRFGFRTLRFDSNLGFFINDQPVKMKGVCLHHDLGPLGAAVNVSAMRRQLEMLKEMGCNAIRTGHTPPAPELPALASEMGILILDEMFDEWKYPKMDNGYHTLWDEWAERDLRALIKRDRNHPAVIMWSLGNEIVEQGKEDGGEICQFLVDIAHDEDPTRPTTAGFNNPEGAIENGLAEAIDIPGWNYRLYKYVHFHTLLPHKPTYGSETDSIVSSRGEFVPSDQGEDWKIEETLQANSYDLSSPGWGLDPDLEFKAQDECDFIMGEFFWTGFDYLGEPTPYWAEWPSRSSYFGIVDLGGIPKSRYYLYQSKWSDKEVLYLLPHWNWAGHEGQTIPVHCYTSFRIAELFVNGKSMGKRYKGLKSITRSPYRLMWPAVPYEAGELKVVAYDKSGTVMGEYVINTAGAPAKLELCCESDAIKADGEDMAFVTVAVRDHDANLCPRADNTIAFSVTGPAEIAAVCNGDATSLESFQGTRIKAFNGMCVVYLRSLRGQAGVITLAATSGGLAEAEVKINCGATSERLHTPHPFSW
jgi:beta-galactosidase